MFLDRACGRISTPRVSPEPDQEVKISQKTFTPKWSLPWGSASQTIPFKMAAVQTWQKDTHQTSFVLELCTSCPGAGQAGLAHICVAIIHSGLQRKLTFNWRSLHLHSEVCPQMPDHYKVSSGRLYQYLGVRILKNIMVWDIFKVLLKDLINFIELLIIPRVHKRNFCIFLQSCSKLPHRQGRKPLHNVPVSV